MAELLGKSALDYRDAGPDRVPEEIRQMCRLADIQSKSLLLQIVRQSSPAKNGG